jgi:hypothetical protein
MWGKTLPGVACGQIAAVLFNQQWMDQRLVHCRMMRARFGAPGWETAALFSGPG